MLNEDCKDGNANWTCTENYNNTLYSKYACPFNSAKCGSSDNFTLDGIGRSLNLSFNMTRGDICFYKIKTKCGVLKTDVISITSGSNVLIEFIEFENG